MPRRGAPQRTADGALERLTTPQRDRDFQEFQSNPQLPLPHQRNSRRPKIRSARSLPLRPQPLLPAHEALRGRNDDDDDDDDDDDPEEGGWKRKE